MWKFKRNIVNVYIGSNTCRHVKNRKDYVHEQRVGQNVTTETFQTAGHHVKIQGTIMEAITRTKAVAARINSYASSRSVL